MKKFNVLTLSLAACFFVFTSSASTPAKPKPKKSQSGIVMTNLDNSVKPSADFYQYACGGWMKNNPLPSEFARYGSFDVLAENNQKQLKELVTKLAGQKHNPGTLEQKVGDLYLIGMDTVAIEKQGAQPIQAELQTIATLKREGISLQLANMMLDGNSPFFGFFPAADPDNSAMGMGYFWQSGLGIGDRDYYLEEGQKDIREAYVTLMTTMFRLSGYSKLAGYEGREEVLARMVLALETRMAQVTMDKNTLRDPYATIHKCSPADFQKSVPAFNVSLYLKTLGVNPSTINIGQPEYLSAISDLLTITDMDAIRAYLAWNVINSAAPYLSKEFVEADFQFYGKVLSGKEENSPRWKRVINTIDGSLGEALGQMYVKSYFPAEAKDRMDQLVKNLQWALGERIKASTWMTAETQKAALDKLGAFTVKIGYPDKWRDYSNLAIEKDSYYANVMRARRFDMAYSLSKVDKPVDKTEWQMTPQTVNAYYDPTTNEICFPAGILQAPFFDMNADDAFNYGAIGVVIGHEMTHGFDDQGRNYDMNGNVADWWTEADSKAFAERTQVLVNHFNAIEVAPGVFANGEFTLGENIADNGGLNVSYTAFLKAIQDGAIKGDMDGFTPAQRFFLAYAGVWAANIRDAEILRRTKEDPHSLGKWRVNGTLPHIDAFYKAFNIREGDAMYLAPEKRARIW